MIILFLTDSEVSRPLIDYLSKENTIIFTDSPNAEFVISYNYRKIIPHDFIERFKGRIINLHISYLPYNRGADPLFWSVVEHTPCGVTIHEVDDGVDTGDILVQEKVELTDEDTLKTGYEKLHERLQRLFIHNWNNIRLGRLKGRAQSGESTTHRKKDIYELKIGVLKKLALM